MRLFLNHRTHSKCNSILVIVNKWGVTLIENSQVGFHWLAIMRPDWSIHANWGFSMVDRQSNWSLISAVWHIWAPYHHDQCWVSLLPTAPGGVPSGGMEVLMMWWHSFLPSLTLSVLRRPKEIKLQNIDEPKMPNTKYRDGNKYKIQITGLATNTKYRAGNKTELDQSQSLGLAAFLPEQPVEFHLHSCQNNLHNQFCNLQKDLKIHLPLQSQIKAAMIQL